VLDGGSLCESESEKGDCATQVLFWRTWEDEAACLRVHRSLGPSHVEPWLGEVDPEKTESSGTNAVSYPHERSTSDGHRAQWFGRGALPDGRESSRRTPFPRREDQTEPTGGSRLRSGTSELAEARTGSCRPTRHPCPCRHAGACSVVNHAGLIRRTARKPCLRWRMRTWALRDSRIHLLCHRWLFVDINPSRIV
jgi:hypothetical protein